MISKATKEDILDRASKKAGDYEQVSVNCAQGTLAALQEEFDLGGGDDIIRSAIFMPGIVSRGETCGAVIGGLMALGLAFGKNKIKDAGARTPEAKEKMFEFKVKAWKFCEEFKSEFGSTLCGDIRPKIMGRDYDTMDPKESQQFLDDGGANRCRIPAEIAARIAAKIMLEK